MTKRIISLILSLMMSLSFFSCGHKVEPWLHPDVTSSFPETEDVPLSGHVCVFEDDGDGDYIKLVKCSDPDCGKYGRPEAVSECADDFADYFDFEDEKKEICDFCDALLFDLKRAKNYGASDTPDDGMKERFNKLDEYADMCSDIVNIVSLRYYSDIKRYGGKYREAKELSDSFREITSNIEIAAYESVYRDVCFSEEDGWTDEDIEEEIEFAKLVTDEEYSVLLERIEDATFKLFDIADVDESEELPVLYSELVEANNAFASFMGYDNYYEYAMENKYDRDYTTRDAKTVRELCKGYIAPLMWEFYDKLSDHLTEDLPAEALFAEDGSFISDQDACDALYSFYKRVASVQNGEDMTYYDGANDALSSGNITISDSENAFETAYTSYLEGLGIPVMYFCSSLCNADTFVHEYGHYYSCLTGTFSGVSLDINEMQSQGAQFLYISYLKEYFDENGIEGYSDMEYNTLMNRLLLTVYSIADDEFEEAVYSGVVDGIDDPEDRLSDGISSDEYDYLYERILDGYGFAYGDRYWRGTVTVSPCYYLSYAVSYINCFEIYASALEDGFDSAASKYLELFDFPYDDGFDEREASDVEFYSERAGIASPFEESAYLKIYRALSGLIE